MNIAELSGPPNRLRNQQREYDFGQQREPPERPAGKQLIQPGSSSSSSGQPGKQQLEKVRAGRLAIALVPRCGAHQHLIKYKNRPHSDIHKGRRRDTQHPKRTGGRPSITQALGRKSSGAARRACAACVFCHTARADPRRVPKAAANGGKGR